MNVQFKNNKVKNIIVLALVIACIPLFIIMGTLWFLLIDIITDDVIDLFEGNTSFYEITYTVPDIFDYEYGDTIITYENKDGVGICDMSVSEHDKEDDFGHWFRGNIFFSLNDEVDDITEVDINNNTALYTKRVSEYGTEYFYGFESINNYYLLTYTIYNDNHGDNVNDDNECYSSLDKVLSSIEIK